MVIFTGLPDFLASKAASGSRYGVSFPPNPPPISIGTTLIRDTGISNKPATASRMPKCPCELHQIVNRPSGDHDAAPF